MPKKEAKRGSKTITAAKKDYVILGIELISATADGPKKFLIEEGDKKIWRDERLISDRSKKTYLLKLQMMKRKWLERMAENDLPSCPDTEEDEMEERRVEEKLTRHAKDILGSPPRKQVKIEPVSGSAEKHKTFFKRKAQTLAQSTKAPEAPSRLSPSKPAPVRLSSSPTKSTLSSPSRKSPVKKSVTILETPKSTAARPTIMSSLKKFFFSSGTQKSSSPSPAGSCLPIEIVDAEEREDEDLNWQTQGL